MHNLNGLLNRIVIVSNEVIQPLANTTCYPIYTCYIYVDNLKVISFRLLICLFMIPVKSCQVNKCSLQLELSCSIEDDTNTDTLLPSS